MVYSPTMNVRVLNLEITKKEKRNTKTKPNIHGANIHIQRRKQQNRLPWVNE